MDTLNKDYLFNELKEIVRRQKERLDGERQMDKDWELHQKKFNKELKVLLEGFLLKHFGKDYNSDLFGELHLVLTDLLNRYQAKPNLF